MLTRLLRAFGDQQAIASAAELLLAGELVAFPTETVYGLGAAAFLPAAVASVFVAKGRPSDNPLIVHVADMEQVESVTHRLGDIERRLAEAFWPGPLTLISPAVAGIPPEVTAGHATVAIRMPHHDVALELIRLAGPLVAPSANRSGYPSPTTAQHVMHDLGGRIAAVLDGGACRIGLESTVVRVSRRGSVEILRPGDISASDIAEALDLEVVDRSVLQEGEVPISPGMKYRHYAPEASVLLCRPVEPPSQVSMLLTPHPERFPHWQGPVRRLESATLYASLREADTLGVTIVVVDYSAEVASNAALANRLRKAASRR